MTAIRINLRGNYISQYGGFNFTSMCMFKGQPLAAGPDGIFQLETGKKDVYTAITDERRINGWAEYPTSALGADLIKKLRRLYVRGEFDGDCQIICIAKGEVETRNTYDITPRNTNNVQHTIQVKTDHTQNAEEWAFLVENVNGADFSIDAIDAIAILVTRRRGL